MKNFALIPKPKLEHGGAFYVGRRHSRRPLNTKAPLHITLRSDLAVGTRSLLKHQAHIESVIQKSAKKFDIRIYNKAICATHIHLLIRGKYRTDIQNFFRVVAGHIAQEILRLNPLKPHESSNRGNASHDKVRKPRYQRKFWAQLIYSKILSWGRQFHATNAYVAQNILEALGLIPYKTRLNIKRKFNTS